VAAIPPFAFALLFKLYLNQRFANVIQYYLPRHEEDSRTVKYSEEADIAGHKLDHVKDMPVLHRLLKGNMGR
jgi:hypothetical protein